MVTSEDVNLSVIIKNKAYELGFDLCGIAQSRPLKERETILKSWCSEGMNAGMAYLNKDIDKRCNPEFLVPGAKSLIVTGLGYYSEKRQKEPGVPVLSRYAYGESYHTVLKRKLDKLMSFIKSVKPETSGRIFVD